MTGWISTNGGATWNNNLPALPSVDPTVVVSGNPDLVGAPNGRFFAGHLLTAVSDLAAPYKDNPAGAWTTLGITVDSADKPWLCVDNSPHSPPVRRYNLYLAYSSLAEPLGDVIKVQRSTTDGVAWGDEQILSNPTTNAHPAHIQTGRLGRVYVVWYRPAGQFGQADSENGLNYSAESTIGISFTGMSPSNLRNKDVLTAPTWPRIAVDWSDAAADDLYLVYAGLVTGKAGPEILIARGDAQAGNPVSWNAASIRTVNQDLGDNDQWWPEIAWDNAPGCS